MAPPGRRRNGAMQSHMVLLAAFLLFSSIANAAVLGIDFGTLNIKAVLVKPGMPFEIVLTKDSKRKEAAAVAFKPTRDGKNDIIAEAGAYPERVYGPDALALQGRLPGEVFPNLKPLLGDLTSSEVPEAYKARYPAVQLTTTGGQASFKSTAFHKGELPWSVEELLAMELANIRRNAESLAGRGSTVQDVVITVPVFYTAQEKAAVSRAAELAGLNVMSLITDGLAVGLDYAKSRTFPSISEGLGAEHHLVFDMGAGSTTATLLRFQSRSIKDVGRLNKTVQEVAVIGAGWDRQLGGDALNQVIVTDYLDKFMTKPVVKSQGITREQIEGNARAMSRIVKEAEKARQVLSANTETSSSFEELLPDVDFRTKLTRAEFEKLTEDYASRVAKPIEAALSEAGITIDEVDSIILYGGAVRTPFVQRALEQVVGSSSAKLKSNVNADESAVFGAAFRAAALSPSFKVKDIRSSDLSGYPSGLVYGSDAKERSQVVFPALSPSGNNASTKVVSFKQKSDFTFKLHQNDLPYASVATQNLTDSVKQLKENFACELTDISTKFSVRLSPVDGLPEVVIGTVSCETNHTAKTTVGDSVKGWLGFGKKKDQEALEDDEEAGPTEQVTASTDASSASATGSDTTSASASKAPEKAKTRTETINVAFKTSRLDQPSSAEIQRMRDRLAAFDRSDKSRLAREEAMNVLESYTYYARDFLANTDYSTFSTEVQRGAISKLLQTTRDFMDDHTQVSKATEKIFKEKLAGLKDLVQPILQRRTESESRPAKLKSLRSLLGESQSMIDSVKQEIKSASAAAKEALASSTPAAGDDLDDLEEPSSDDDYKPPTTDLTTVYTEDDISSFQAIYDQVKSWLSDKETAQKDLESHEDPAFVMKDIDKQSTLLSDARTRLLMKKIRAPPKSSKSKTTKSKSKTATSKSASTAADSTVTDLPESESSGAAKPSIVTVGEGDDMPSEEEILRMVSQARAKSTTKDEL